MYFLTFFYFQGSIQGDLNTVWSEASLFDTAFIILYIVSANNPLPTLLTVHV